MRGQLGLPKTHFVDAACVGSSTPEHLDVEGVVVLTISAVGHGTRQMCGTNKAGFPIRQRSRKKRHFGFQTGDMARAVVPVGKRQGTHEGRVLVRASGSFDIVTAHGREQGISHRYCQILAHVDGYSYTKGDGASSPALKKHGASAPRFL